ncbi:MAG: nitroreductase family protein [Chloroflexi bacterium]|nr:nitroreductase family protein [Chloroflexota bacterium]
MNDSDPLHHFLRTRRTVRKFAPRPVSEETLRRILETATYAPSARNRQPWQFTVVSNMETKRSLADDLAADFRPDLERDGLPEVEIETRLDRTRRRILDAPVIIALSLNPDRVDAQPNRKRQEAERSMAVQSVALAGLQLMLAAHAEGLASVWTCGPLFAPDAIRFRLGLPANWQPQAMFFLGYPAETPEVPGRLNVEEVTTFIR